MQGLLLLFMSVEFHFVIPVILSILCNYFAVEFYILVQIFVSNSILFSNILGSKIKD